MGRRPKDINISLIAKEAGLSVSTVSRAMNHRANVSEETRRKINLLMAKYNFIPTPATPRAKKIALLSGSTLFNEYVAEIFNGIYHYTESHGLETTLLFKESHSVCNLLERIRDQQCSGVVVILPAEFSDSLDLLAASELPVIQIDEAVQRTDIGFIDHDSYSGSREAVKHLLSLGHRRIGYLASNTRTLNHIQRYKAYENTMSEAGITINPDWCIETTEALSSYAEAAEKMRELLTRAPELTAVMTTNDMIALGAISGALAAGRRIPTELSIIGFDNYPQTAFLNPPLTTVHHPIADAGFLAAKSIDEFLKNPQDAQLKLPREILPTRLVVRGTTAPPRG